MMFGLLLARTNIEHRSLKILSDLIKPVHQYKRFYRSVNGVFGNYSPQQVNIDHWCRNKQLLTGIDSSYMLIKNAFQNRGHLLCQLDPLHLSNLYPNADHRFNLETMDNQEFFNKLGQILGVNIEEFLAENNQDIDNRKEFLQQQLNIYCGPIGYEISQLISLNEYDWFVERIERDYKLLNENSIFNEQWQQKAINLLFTTEALDHFLAKKFQSIKRYGCEGAETMIIFIQELINQLQDSKLKTTTANGCHNFNVDEIIIGMAHRGRLNLLVNTLHYPLEALFHKLSGKAEFYSEYSGKPETKRRSANIIGDVLSHLYTSTEYLSTDSQNGHNEKKFDYEKLKVTMLPNPSHLEVVSPVVCGYARGKLLRQRRGPYNQSANEQESKYCLLPVQIHGDASFSGQGIIMETLALANAQHFTVGGSIHLVINNQIGYTTPGRMYQGRSSLYCTDPVKMIHAPVIHVNGDYPELVAQAARLALDYQQTFNKDIAVNLVCFRRWGHNELDDPTFTNPIMYERIGKRKSIPEQYAQHLQVSQEKTDKIVNDYNQLLNKALANMDKYEPPSISNILIDGRGFWRNIGWATNSQITKWNTSVPENLLKHIGLVSVSSPDNFNLHRTLKKVFNERENKLLNGENLDWATAELLAIGTLLYQGIDVRISGQDVGRGTFSQRHAMIVDQISNDVHVPLNDIINHHREDLPWKYECFGQLEVCNSILSEEAVLAYEYGLSLTNSQLLTIWEAQFGDFFNGAQAIIDILVANGETKWLLQSALTLLLPNGYDGAGPEHTSARLERFLQQSNSSETEIDSDNVNWSIVYPTTPAQYFHLLRRQMLRPYRKPLVVMSPKLLLRHPRCVSMLTEMTQHNAHFMTVLDDPKYYDPTYRYQTKSIDTVARIDSVRSIIFCSGKHYYTLEKEREQRLPVNDKSIAIVRLEELCPFPALELTLILKRYPNAKKLIWSQEEHQNMGGWSFISTRFRNILKINNLEYAGRGPLEASAVGILQLHQKEIAQVLKETFDLAKE